MFQEVATVVHVVPPRKGRAEVYFKTAKATQLVYDEFDGAEVDGRPMELKIVETPAASANKASPSTNDVTPRFANAMRSDNLNDVDSYFANESRYQDERSLYVPPSLRGAEREPSNKNAIFGTRLGERPDRYSFRGRGGRYDRGYRWGYGRGRGYGGRGRGYGSRGRGWGRYRFRGRGRGFGRYRGRGRGFGRYRGRGRGRGRGGRFSPEDLDSQLDTYMSKSSKKVRENLDDELDAYAKERGGKASENSEAKADKKEGKTE